MSNLSEDEFFMDLAIREAKKGAKIGEVPIGCVIVYKGEVIGKGYNRRKNDKTTLAHAEITAIKQACKKMGDWRLEDCTLYVTLEPCQMCAGAIVQARIPKVIFASRNPKAGCAGSILNLFTVEAFNHQVEVTEGVRGEECSRMLTSFFKELRYRLKMEKEPMELRKKLFELQDLEYKAFTEKLVPNVDADAIIGIRVPVLRALAKEYAKEEESKEFLSHLPHKYHEENSLHAFLLETIRDFDTCVKEVDRFLAYVDNWAVCDSMKPKVFKKHPDELLYWIKKWIRSKHPYKIRFAIEMLMNFYLDDAFDIQYPQMVSKVASEDYYVKMMVAWYFATALAKQYDSVIPFMETNALREWEHNKTIQKSVESFRIPKERKEYLKSLKRIPEKQR